MDPISITILIILIGIGGILAKIHIKRCRSACISGECYDDKNKNKDSRSSLNLKDVSNIVFADV